MYNKHLIPAMVLAGAGWLLSACQHSPQADALPQELRSFSVVSTSARTFSPQPGARVQWRDDIIVHAAAGTPQDTDSLNFIRQQIESQLLAKGYHVVPAGQMADYRLQGLIVVGNELNEKELGDVLGFNPGLVTAGTPYQTGSLLLILLNAQSQETEWRSAVEILSAPDLPEETRQQRLRQGVTNLLRPLPALAHP